MIDPYRAPLRDLDWVLVLAPYRRDGVYMEALLSEHGMRVRRCTDTGELVRGLSESPGVIVATHEALTPDVIEAISMHLLAQPNWSELPVVVLLDRSVAHHRVRSLLDMAWPGARQIYYQRPVASLELISGIQSALAVRRRQREVRDHIDKEMEFRLELNHRVKNILATVASIFQMTRRGAHSVEELADDFEGRLSALSNVHASVFEAGGEAVSLARVIELTVLPYRRDDDSRIDLAGPDLLVAREAATTLALCLHELTTNAIKYGALSSDEGKVALTWHVTDGLDQILTIEWAESGGPPVTQPARTGYGTRYLRSALSSLFGQAPAISYDVQGLRFTVGGALPRVMNPGGTGAGAGQGD